QPTEPSRAADATKHSVLLMGSAGATDDGCEGPLEKSKLVWWPGSGVPELVCGTFLHRGSLASGLLLEVVLACQRAGRRRDRRELASQGSPQGCGACIFRRQFSPQQPVVGPVHHHREKVRLGRAQPVRRDAVGFRGYFTLPELPEVSRVDRLSYEKTPGRGENVPLLLEHTEAQVTQLLGNVEDKFAPG